MSNMVLSFTELDLTDTQRYIVKEMYDRTQYIDQQTINGKERAYFSLLMHLTEGYVLDPCYIIEKLGQLFPDYSWKVKSY